MHSRFDRSRVVMLVVAALCMAAMLVSCGGPNGSSCQPAKPIGPTHGFGEMYSERPAAVPTATPAAGPVVKVLEVGNGLAIRAGGTAPSFTLDKPATLVDLMTYHFIEGGGPAPGTLGVKDAAGKTYGPWPCTGIDGQGPTKNAFWDTKPNAALAAGTYTIVDSSPGTWSTNSKAGGVGFTTVQVVYDK